jgi:hypothetical protein
MSIGSSDDEDGTNEETAVYLSSDLSCWTVDDESDDESDDSSDVGAVNVGIGTNEETAIVLNSDDEDSIHYNISI